jgi:hypothetical protein
MELDENYKVIMNANISGQLSECFTGEKHPNIAEADFINQVKDLYQYWSDSEIDTDAEKLNGLFCSIMGLLDEMYITPKYISNYCGNIAGYLHESLGFYKGEQL